MNVLITGATGALGTAVTAAFLRAGASVTGVGRGWRDPRPPIRALELDLSAAEGAAEAVRAASETAPLDAVVHLLGGFGGGEAVGDDGIDLWKQQFDINLFSALHTFRAALPAMRSRGQGRLIAIGSRAAVEPLPKFTAYATSKAALVALVRGIAAETNGTGVTANIVLPSTIDTAANRKAMPQADPSKWVKAESIAGLLLWLASDAAADVNGAVIPIYGGS
ncbi:MAG: SDR family NAD(P)-dependent oxidoreductase [Bryobacteraceae bacterium]|nr:SDR family NAD(P)-dependent oxidoreductase [Bryobacteraceae bacterium]